MGVVYEAVDVRLKRKVAIKALREGHGSIDRKRRFLQEAQAASRLNHPNIVTVHDVDSANGVDFIVMEYVDGTPLNRLIGPAGLPLDRMLDYARQITSALAAAHGAGIVHRDLKPSNIMLARDGRIKIRSGQLSPASEDAGSHARRKVRLRFPCRDLAEAVVRALCRAGPTQASRDLRERRARAPPDRVDS
jgi:serine/threonine protein kinase